MAHACRGRRVRVHTHVHTERGWGWGVGWMGRMRELASGVDHHQPPAPPAPPASSPPARTHLRVRRRVEVGALVHNKVKHADLRSACEQVEMIYIDIGLGLGSALVNHKVQQADLQSACV